MRYLKSNRSLPVLASVAAVLALGAPAVAQQAQVKSTSDIVVAQYRAPQYRARISPIQVREILQRAGYRRVSDIRYFQARGRDNFYTANGWFQGRIYVLRVSDQTGRIVGRTLARGRYTTNPYENARVRGVDRIEVRQALVRQGYTGITDVRFIDNVRNDHFVATAWKGGRQYRLIIDDDYGRILSRTRIR